MPKNGYFIAGTSDGLIIFWAVIYALIWLPILYVLFRIFVLTPYRIKYKRTQLGEYTIFHMVLILIVYLSAVGMGVRFLTEQKGFLKAENIYLADHPTKVQKKYTTAKVLEAVFHEESGHSKRHGFILLARDKKTGKRFVRRVGEEDWLRIERGTVVVFEESRKRNKFVPYEHEKTWRFTDLSIRGPAKLHYSEVEKTRKGMKRHLDARVVDKFYVSDDYELHGYLIKLRERSGAVFSVRFSQRSWWKLAAGDKVRLKYHRKEKGKRWRLMGVSFLKGGSGHVLKK